MKKFIFLLIISSCFHININAQSDSNKIKAPTLNGHQFSSTGYISSSFINTNLQANIGIGITSPITLQGVVINDVELFAFEGKILFFDTQIQYQQRFTDWLALYGTIKMAGRIGTNMSTIVVDGVNTLSGGDIGWLIRIKQGKKFNLSADISIHKITGNFINVVKYLEDLIDNNPNASITVKVPAMSVNTGLRYAYAFNPAFGIQATGNFSYGESLRRNESAAYFSGGIVGEVDFNPNYQVPIGLSIGYGLTSFPDVVMNNGGVSNLFSSRIGYTGSTDFELGIQYSFYDMYLESLQEKAIVSKLQLILKFYF